MKRRKSGTKTVGINQEKSKDEGGGRGRALSQSVFAKYAQRCGEYKKGKHKS